MSKNINNKNNIEEIEVRKCEYCGAHRPKEEMHLGEINVNHGHKKGWFCNDRPCEAHAQMAAEG